MQGCVSQVWLSTHVDRSGNVPRLSFIGDSDAHIVRGLIAILFSLYSGKTADEIVRIDAGERLGLLHLNEHLTPQRSNGLMAMVRRIRTDAELAHGEAHAALAERAADHDSPSERAPERHASSVGR